MCEIVNNHGLPPKILIRFGMWGEQRKPIQLVLIALYRLVDLVFCKLMSNCGISTKAHIGYGAVIYYSCGILINADTVIGANFTCRVQVTICSKRTIVNDDCSTIGNNVNVGVGTKIVDPITFGDGYSIGANAAVTHFFTVNRILLGIHAKASKRR